MQTVAADIHSKAWSLHPLFQNFSVLLQSLKEAKLLDGTFSQVKVPQMEAESNRKADMLYHISFILGDSPHLHFITSLMKAGSGAQVAQLQPWHGSTSRSG